MKKIVVILVIIACWFVYISFSDDVNKPVHIPATEQRTGDANKGFDYLTTGDYLKSGIPYNTFLFVYGKDKRNLLPRDDYNKYINYDFTAVKAPNGEMVVAPNCLQCHAQIFEDKVFVGMGNSFMDFSHNNKNVSAAAGMLYNMLSTVGPKKLEASKNFLIPTKTVTPFLTTEVQGVNAAGRLTILLAAHRNPTTFEWSDAPSFKIDSEVVPTDVPAWWLLKKKNAMFYSGAGRGDFGRFLMASNLLTVSDTSESREVDTHFNDVLAYIRSIEAPKYPRPLDEQLVIKGKELFNNNCSRCHGTYGEGGEYPNLLIPAAVIKTDSALYRSSYSNSFLVEWFNKSWFNTGEHPAKLVPYNGYIAPPLDGIWVTAPYFHNGSVPNLEAVLKSSSRPTYWLRDFDKAQYDYDNPGWKYKELSAPKKNAYNTTVYGYSNAGHYFGDKLNDIQRKAVIEYLKTL